MILEERVSWRNGKRGFKEEMVGIRRFWVRKTEPWAAIRRDSKREVRRDRNYTISNTLRQVGDVRSYLVDAEMCRCHACARQCLAVYGFLVWDVCYLIYYTSGKVDEF